MTQVLPEARQYRMQYIENGREKDVVGPPDEIVRIICRGVKVKWMTYRSSMIGSWINIDESTITGIVKDIRETQRLKESLKV